MRRIHASLLLLALLLVTGCDQAPTAREQTSSVAARESSTTTAFAASEPTSSATTSTNLAISGGQTYEAVILDPADEPVAAADIAPQLFREEPSIREVLETALPASLAEKEGQYVFQGTHLILVLSVAGAAESATGVEMYAELWEQWFALAGWQPVQDTGGIYPVRIRLARDGDAFRLEGVDKPKDGEGYISSLDEMMPTWVRDLVDHQARRAEMEEALLVAAADWARPNVPADLFVDQAPSTIPDPHEHQPPSSEYRMLAARYIDCEVVKIPTPPSGDYQPEFACASEDGRFRLFFLPSGVGVLDTQTGEWRSIVAPGWPMTAAVSPSDPVWRDHTLFIDFQTTFIDPLRPTLTHYEIDFDSMTVVRAVPMGPLSFNEPAM